MVEEGEESLEEGVARSASAKRKKAHLPLVEEEEGRFENNETTQERNREKADTLYVYIYTCKTKWEQIAAG